MNPTEGLSDAYRDLAFIGGIPDKNFIERLAVNHVSANDAKREDLAKEMDADPLVTAPVWQDKIADTSKIEVPAFVIGSYSNTLYTMGTFRAWRTLGSKDKWLRIHDRQEWPYYYDKNNTEELRRFFDHYLLGKDNGWENTAPVRYTTIGFQGKNETDIPATSFPPAGVNNQPIIIDNVLSQGIKNGYNLKANHYVKDLSQGLSMTALGNGLAFLYSAMNDGQLEKQFRIKIKDLTDNFGNQNIVIAMKRSVDNLLVESIFKKIVTL
nr:hypothetical protein [Pediococcus pentosaceus]